MGGLFHKDITPLLLTTLYKGAHMSKIFIKSISILTILIISLACGSSKDSSSNATNPFTNESVIISTVASDYSSGSFSIINTSNFGVSSSVKSYDTSDIVINTYNQHFYVIGRYQGDFIEKYSISSPTVNVFPNAYKTIDGSETTSNPQELIFASEQVAYLTRRNSSKQWIVNPSANVESSFKTGELDLSAYDEGSGSPEITTGTIVGNNLFLIAQRLDSNSATTESYLIVIDTTTNTEVNTGKSSTLNGIPLPAQNPSSIQYLSETGLLYINCVGQYGSSFSGTKRRFNGGVVTVNPSTYDTALLIDDGDNAEVETTATGTHGGLFTNSVVLNSTKGYLVTYAGWQNTALKTFNPSTQTVGSVVASLEGKDIRGISIDNKNQLWVSTGTGVTVVNTTDDSVLKTDLDIGLVPNASAKVVQY